LGVVICNCSESISELIDIPFLKEKARHLADECEVHPALCTKEGIEFLKGFIKEKKLERVVIAACTPKLYESLFRKACQEAGVNPNFVEIANIREQCAWVHRADRTGATAKALAQVRMAITRSLKAEPVLTQRLAIQPRALVVGGGVAGLNAGLKLSHLGYDVEIVEKTDQLGGLTKELFKLYPTNVDATVLVKDLVQRVRDNKKIKVHLNSQVKSVTGKIGNYEVTVDDQKLIIGIIVVATGAQVLKPYGLYAYDGKNVITQLELEKLLKEGRLKAKTVVMIQCVGAMGHVQSYCSKICCMVALKNSMLIKELYPKTNVVVLYQVIQTYGIKYEDDHRRARGMGIAFFRYTKDKPPKVEPGKVTFYHDFLGDEVEIDADLVVLSTPLVPQDDAAELAQAVGCPLDEDKFFLEANIKLRPVDSAKDGIYLAGSCRWPCDVDEAVTLACAAAGRAALPLAAESIVVGPSVGSISEVSEERCIGCRLCTYLCAANAITVIETENGLKARADEVFCKGCGICVAACPEKAIELKPYKEVKLLAQVKAALD